MNKTLAYHDRMHVQRVLLQQNRVGRAFNQFIYTVSPFLRKWSDRGSNSVWVRNAAVEKAVDKAIETLQASLLLNIQEFQTDAWNRANKKEDEMIDAFIQGMSISSLVKDGMFKQNLDAFKEMQNRFDNGLNLSQKVWSVAEQAKTQLEFYLGSGVSVGRSADGISRDIRQLLDKPDKRFRRVRNEKGVLQLSKPMQDYHPGAGTYRSSKMNALRLAATETNISYRRADYERWQKLDFVLGIDVKRSPSNHGPCKICDAMVGAYPKGFKFFGWHPFCICIATPRLQKPEDFANFLLDEQIPSSQFVNDIPQDARKFMAENEYMQNSYGYRDNKDWFTGKVNPVDRINANTERAKVINEKAEEWASVIKDTSDREVTENAAKKLLQLDFDLPRIDYKDLGRKTKRGLVTAHYDDGAKKININSNPAIRKSGGLEGLGKDGVNWGWSAQNNIVLHELSHYINSVLDPQYNSVEYGWSVELDKKLVYDNLSQYAYTKKAEFEAELISGILSGKNYPEEIMNASFLKSCSDPRAKKIFKMGLKNKRNVLG